MPRNYTARVGLYIISASRLTSRAWLWCTGGRCLIRRAERSRDLLADNLPEGLVRAAGAGRHGRRELHRGAWGCVVVGHRGKKTNARDTKTLTIAGS